MASPKAIASASSSPVAAGAFVNGLNGQIVSNGFLMVIYHASQGASLALTGGGEVINAPVKITLDVNGVPSAGQSIFCTDQFVNQVGLDITIYTSGGSNVGFITNASVTGAAPVDLTAIVNTASGSLASPVITNPSGNQTITQPAGTTLTISGAIALTSVNGLAEVYADQYASVSAAITALPAAGGTVDATSPNVNLALGTIDPGTKCVHIKLGPFTYTCDHIVMRSGLWLDGASGQTNGTVIQSVGANSQPLLVIAQVNSTNVADTRIEGIRFLGAAGNTSQEGLFADVSGTTSSVFEYSSLRDLWFLNFVGPAIHLKGRTADVLSANQFLNFENVKALRPSGSNPILKVEGYAGQCSFYDCEFDGAAFNDGVNIYLGSGGGTSQEGPNTFYFRNITSQNGSQCFQLDGVHDVEIDGLHTENTAGCVLVSMTSSGNMYNSNINFHSSFIAANSAVNSSNGYIINVTDTGVHVFPSISFHDNSIEGTPDNIILLANSNSAIVNSYHNHYATSPSAAAPTTNVTTAQSPAATLDIRSWDHMLVTASGTSITTLKGSHLPGEKITFYASGTMQFATGGNLILGNYASPLVLNSGDSATFVRMDGGTAFRLESTTSLATPPAIGATTPNTGAFTTLSAGSGTFTLNSSGLPTKSNNLTLAGQGLTPIVAVTSQKSETAADTNVLTLTPPAAAGTYRILFVLSLSAANTATLGWTATWKDSNGNAQTPTNLSLFQSGTAAPALTFATSAAGNYYGSAIIDIDNSATNIVVKLTFTGTSFAGKASATIERIS